MSSVLKTSSSLGPYRLEQLLGEGGFGKVYRGQHTQTGQAVALKVLSEEAAADEVLISRFEREFRSARLLSHPNIVAAYDFVTTEGPPFLVMEYVEGESLGVRLEREGALSEAETRRIAVGLCRGLHFAHLAGVIHRDIKPDNILLTTDGRVKIADFGLSKELFAHHELTKPGQGLGTPYYMAPELFRSAMYADQRSDIYGVAATVYHMATGRPPFSGVKIREILNRKIRGDVDHPTVYNPNISKPLEQVILKGLRIDPSQRQTSLADFERQLTLNKGVFDSTMDSTAVVKSSFRPVWAVPAEPSSTLMPSVNLAGKLPWRMIAAFITAAILTWAISVLFM